jgi:hypothetical protein
MKAMKAIKKMVALGMGLTMVGATIFGASAVKLSDWPVPFVVDGSPASNLAIIVGANAAGSDVVGAVDVIQALQTSAVKRIPGYGGGSQTVIEGDAVEVGSTSNLLEIGESIGNVRETFTEVDLDLLRGGQIVTRQGSTEYNQYLRFPDNGVATGITPATLNVDGSTIFGPDERDRVGHYLYWDNGDLLFTWELEFEQGLLSRYDCERGKLRDIEDKDITILGQPFVIVDANLFSQTNDSGCIPLTGNPLQITFIGGAISAVMGENDKETYVVDGKEYEIEVMVISETAGSGDGAVKFRINGEITNELRDGDSDVLVDGTQLGIRSILATGKDIQKSIVQFYLGAYKINFEDNNTTDTVAQDSGAKVNEEVIQDSNVTIYGALDNNQRQYRINNIQYNLFASAILGDLYVPPGTGVREQLDEPEGMLTPNWDIRYEGLMDTGITLVRIDASGNSEYDLEWTNQEGIFYDHKFASNRQPDNAIPVGDGALVYGDRNRDLWFTECSDLNGTTVAQIKRNDYFIVSNCLADPYNDANDASKNTCFTHVLRYDNLDDTNTQITFTDLGTGKRTVSYNAATASGNLVVGGVTYEVRVGANNNLAVDLNADGTIGTRLNESGQGKVLIGVQGEGLLNLGWQACIAQANSTVNATLLNRSQPTLPPTTAIANSSNIVDWINFSLITLQKEFDEAAVDEVLFTNVTARDGWLIGIGNPNVQATSGIFYGMHSLEENEDLEQGLSGYGIFVELYNPGRDKAEDLTYEYPLSQRGSRVFITGGAVSTTRVATGGFEQMQPIQIGAAGTDLEYANTYANYNAIVVGGPCANTVASSLLGNPDPCWETVGENKALIKLFNHANGSVALLINGRTALNTRQGCRAVATGQISSVTGEEAVVTGTTLTDVTVKAV